MTDDFLTRRQMSDCGVSNACGWNVASELPVPLKYTQPEIILLLEVRTHSTGYHWRHKQTIGYVFRAFLLFQSSNVIHRFHHYCISLLRVYNSQMSYMDISPLWRLYSLGELERCLNGRICVQTFLHMFDPLRCLVMFARRTSREMWVTQESKINFFFCTPLDHSGM